MSRDVNALADAIRPLCLQFLDRCTAQGFPVFVTQTRRTMDEQAALYAQGRTTPGKVVTNAKPGTSAHNFGLAFDIAWRTAEGGVTWDAPEPDGWEMVGAIGTDLGLVWGGDFSRFPDRPHFEMAGWRTVAGV